MKTIVGIATTGRRPNQLQKTIESLKDQVDEIRVYDNTQNEDLTDNGKLYFLQEYKEPVYYFSCDDDIIYPKDYVKTTIEAIERHKCIVSYHGRVMRGRDKNYYHGHTTFHCKHNHPTDEEIDICGTGVTAFRTDYFNPTELYKSKFRCMFDIVFSLEAWKQNKKLMHIGHKAKWIIPQELPKGEAIYDNHHRSCEVQTELCKKIWDIKHK